MGQDWSGGGDEAVAGHGLVLPRRLVSDVGGQHGREAGWCGAGHEPTGESGGWGGAGAGHTLILEQPIWQGNLAGGFVGE